MDRRADLGRIAIAICDAGWICARARAGDPKGRNGDAEFCGRADAAWTNVFGRRLGTHCAADGREGVEFGGGGRASAGGGIQGVLCEREAGTARKIFRDLFAAGLEGATVFVVDDFPATQI